MEQMLKHTMKSSLLASCAAFYICVMPVTAQVAFTPLPGLSPTALSGNGLVVVGASLSQPVRWSQTTGVVALQPLVAGQASFASDVNLDGTVIVGTGLRSPNFRRAVRWDVAGIAELIHPDSPVEVEGRAFEVSRDGRTTVGTWNPRGTSSRLLLGNRDATLLQFSPVPTADATRAAMSGDGRVVYVGTHRFVDESWTALPAIAWPLEPNVLPDSELLDIRVTNHLGTAVAGSYVRTRWPEDIEIRTAAFWSLDSTPLDLGDLPGGGVNPESAANSLAHDVNVVVGWGTTDLGQEAFIWNASSGMVNLRTYAQSLGIAGLEGWLLTDALDVSDDGRTILGTGINPDGLQSSWVLTVPSPATLPLMVIAATLGGRRRRLHWHGVDRPTA